MPRAVIIGQSRGRVGRLHDFSASPWGHRITGGAEAAMGHSVESDAMSARPSTTAAADSRCDAGLQRPGAAAKAKTLPHGSGARPSRIATAPRYRRSARRRTQPAFWRGSSARATKTDPVIAGGAALDTIVGRADIGDFVLQSRAERIAAGLRQDEVGRGARLPIGRLAPGQVLSGASMPACAKPIRGSAPSNRSFAALQLARSHTCQGWRSFPFGPLPGQCGFDIRQPQQAWQPCRRQPVLMRLAQTRRPGRPTKAPSESSARSSSATRPSARG